MAHPGTVTSKTRPEPAAVLKKIRHDLPARRYAHCLGTAELAARLAPQARVDPQRAFLAGLLHDCARALDRNRLQAILQAYRGKYFDPATRRHPPLWHDPASVYLAIHDYGVRDPGILRAIARHSTGGPDMRPLDKLVFVADYCESGRTHPDAARIRKLAATAATAASKLAYLRARGEILHPRALALELSLRENARAKAPRNREV